MKVLEKLGVVFDRVIGVLAAFSGILIIYAMLGVSGEVVVRNLFSITTIVVYETTQYALLYMTFAGAAWVLKRDAHVTLDLLVNRLRPRPRALLNIATSLLSAALCFVLFWYGAEVVLTHIQMGYKIVSGMMFPSAPIVAAVPAGFFLLFIQFLRKAYSYFNRLKSGQTR